MSTLRDKRNPAAARAIGLIMGTDEFVVCLPDGRRLCVPYASFPRLENASAVQRGHFEVCARGRLLHWPDIDEDIEVQHLVERRLPVKEPARAMVVNEPRAKYRKA